MKLFRTSLISIILLVYFCSCTQNKTLEVVFLQEGVVKTETIDLSFINKSGNIISNYIDSVKFSYLDSIVCKDNDPDKIEIFSTTKKLNFNNKIEKHSPEYYTAYTIYNITKAIEYYNSLFENRIDFNSQEEYKNIEITIGDVPFLTTPNAYIFEKKSNPSPSLFFHEIGHRAFWYLEDSLKIKFNGLSYIHMGLLEYFTISLNNSPVIGEDALPSRMVRNASWLYSYSVRDSLQLEKSLKQLYDSYPDKIKEPESNLMKYYNANMESYKDYLYIIDNHREGMIITSTLWRIREQLGQSIADELVSKTILNLNEYMNKRAIFYNYNNDEKLSKGIDWYDFYFGLIEKDKELNQGRNKEIIENSFSKTGFPINKIVTT